MKHTLITLLMSVAGLAQTAGWVPCFLPSPGSFPQYFVMTSSSQCESITLDASVTSPPIRSSTGNLIVSALSGVPAHSYTTVLQWPFTASSTFYSDPAGTSPASPFNNMPVWCASTSTAALQTFNPQLNAFLPAMLIELRQAGSSTPVLTTSGVISATSPSNGGRFLWIAKASQCGNNPGIAWTAASSSIVVSGTTTQSNLISVTVIGLL